jgi:hypothetical protein
LWRSEFGYEKAFFEAQFDLQAAILAGMTLAFAGRGDMAGQEAVAFIAAQFIGAAWAFGSRT